MNIFIAPALRQVLRRW